MAYDISDIRKLSVEERLKIIDQIWESCIEDDASLTNEEDILSIVEERIAKYDRGEMKTMSWDEFMARVKSHGR